ncbi:putative membrane protein [Methanomethylovorans hollandica DSM 15978]|uniref:Putative membrane protein n=1 Tax=Methanomethylovorans hollandica (strain DSM 15978 / NBRC 107637 / DMS1) TaxID=867904 RepID=L0KVW0_METHD|nr:YihY/virulence factor BrkB family protein [Methanomethylovorans hollandica]AGB49587.1 putative membrane protein [Methanomethylovorans hollandica DSM 15978]
METRKIKELAVTALKNWRENNSIIDSAALSFYLLLSLPAILLFFVSLGGIFFSSGQVQDNIIEYMEGILDSSLIESLKAFIANMPATDSLSLSALAGLLLLMWGAGNVFRQFKNFLYRIWNVPLSQGKFARNFLKDGLLSTITVIVFGGLIVLITLIEALMFAGSRTLHTYLPLFGVLQYVGPVVAFVVLVILFIFVHIILPDIDMDLKCLVAGSVITAVLITIGKYAVGFYVTHSDITSVYGVIGSIIGLLLWIYYSSIVVTLGAEFTKVYSQDSAGSKKL